MDDARPSNASERKSEFKAKIDRVFAEEIEPYLNAFLADEAEEKKHLRKFRTWIMVPFALLLAAGAAKFVFGSDENVYSSAALILLPGGALVIAAFMRPAPKQRPDLKDLVTQPICQLVGDIKYSSQPVDEIDPWKFQDLGVIQSFNGWHAEHLFVGSHRGTEFRVCEAQLFGLSGKYGSATKFKGRLFDIEVPVPFTCRMLIVGDRGALMNWLGALLRDRFAGMVRMETSCPEFQARYEVFSDAPKEARDILSSDFLAAMVDLAEATNEKALNAAFVDGRFLLALPRQRSLFNIGEVNPPLHQMRNVFEQLVREITLPHRVIDFLHGDRPQLL